MSNTTEVETCETTGDEVELCACDGCQENRWIDTWVEFDVYRDR